MTAWIVAALIGVVPPITEENWREHPAIREIRRVFQDVESLRETERLRRKRRFFADCLAYKDDMSRTLYTDPVGTPRLYTRQAGSEDSAITIKSYYDSQAHLRFVLADAGAINATAIRIRVYFDEAGRLLWENREVIAGPGYPFPDPWPDKWTTRDPVTAFTGPSVCPDDRSN
jgi:hypothetical protein